MRHSTRLSPHQVTHSSGETAAKDAAWWPRAARVVGACVLAEERELVLAALDESGELLDTFKCRWLLTSIRPRRDGTGPSSLEIERKMGELPTSPSPHPDLDPYSKPGPDTDPDPNPGPAPKHPGELARLELCPLPTP